MTIYVKATTADHHCVLWERHPDHPNGECFIVADGKTYEIARTPLVNDYIRTGKLAVVDAPVAPEPSLEEHEHPEPDGAEGELGGEGGQGESNPEGSEGGEDDGPRLGDPSVSATKPRKPKGQPQE